MFAATTNLTTTFANLFLGTTTPFAMDDRYQPMPTEVAALRRLLMGAKQLPADIVDAIFDHAEYWVHSSNEIDYKKEIQNPLIITAGSRSEDKFLVTFTPSFSDLVGLLANQ